MIDIVVKNLEEMKNPHIFADGSRRSITQLPSLIIGRGVYKSGWRWSKHAGSQTGKDSARHIGWLESGRMIIRSADRTEHAVVSGDFFEIGPGHDAWVVGEEPCVAFDFESKN